MKNTKLSIQSLTLAVGIGLAALVGCSKEENSTANKPIQVQTTGDDFFKKYRQYKDLQYVDSLTIPLNQAIDSYARCELILQKAISDRDKLEKIYNNKQYSDKDKLETLNDFFEAEHKVAVIEDTMRVMQTPEQLRSDVERIRKPIW